MKTLLLRKRIIETVSPLYESRECSAIARLVLEEVFHLSFTEVLMDKDTPFDATQQAIFNEILLKLSAGEPVQHILGFANFCYKRYEVNKDVLIPRPETEKLLDICVKEIFRTTLASRPARLLDVGTGSGCIAIELKSRQPHNEMTAWDLSEKALMVARRNAEKLGFNVLFNHVDMLNPPPPEADFAGYDVIVSNPPYIRESERAEMTKNVLDFEPKMALFVPDDDPLRFYKALFDLTISHGAPTVSLCVEVNEALATATAMLFKTLSLSRCAMSPKEESCGHTVRRTLESVEIIKDCFKKERFVVARFSELR